MKLYRLKPSENMDEIGSVFPQAGVPLRVSRQAGQNLRNMRSLEAPQFVPNFDGFEFLPRAKPTDLLSTSMMRYGMMVNSQFLKTVEDYYIQNHLSFNVNIKNGKGESLPYSWIHFLKADVLSHIDFRKSTFGVYNGGKLDAEVGLDSADDFWSKNKELSPTGYVKSIGVEFNSVPDYDLFVVPFIDGSIYVKEKIYNTIISSEVSGVSFEEIEFRFNV